MGACSLSRIRSWIISWNCIFSLIPNQPAVNNPQSFTANISGLYRPDIWYTALPLPLQLIFCYGTATQVNALNFSEPDSAWNCYCFKLMGFWNMFVVQCLWPVAVANVIVSKTVSCTKYDIFVLFVDAMWCFCVSPKFEPVIPRMWAQGCMHDLWIRIFGLYDSWSFNVFRGETEVGTSQGHVSASSLIFVARRFCYPFFWLLLSVW